MLRLGLIAILALTGCGRTHLLEGLDGGFDAGEPDAGATVADAGTPPPLCPPPAPNSGRVWGTTPLGTIDFGNVWVGTEGPWSHSCPHLTVFASPGPAPEHATSLVVDFHYLKPPTLGPAKGLATVQLNGMSANIEVTANVTRADGLTTSSQPSAGWRTTLSFAASDGGWTLQGVLTEVPDCSGATWYCL